MFKNKKNLIIALLLSILILVPFWRWFFTDWLLTQGDWELIYPHTLISYLNLPFLWNWTGLGSPNLTASFYPGYLMQAIVASLGFSYPYVERLVYFFPLVIMGIIGGYIYFTKITQSKISGLIGTIVYNFNTYTLITLNNHVNIINAVSLAPLILFLYEKLFETRQRRFVILTGLLLFIMSAYDFRVFYIFNFVISLYIIVHLFVYDRHLSISLILKRVLIYVTPQLLMFILNLYWILGILKLGLLQNNELFNRGLFGNEFYSLPYSFTLHHPFWTGSLIEVFTVQKIPIFFFCIPIFVALGGYCGRKNPKILLFSIISLAGIFLTKQSAGPFPHAYLWLYENFPGFNAFREASKFYFLVALGYSALIAFFVKSILNKHNIKSWIKIGLTALVACLFLMNTIPMMNGNLDFLFRERIIHNDYKLLNEYLINNDSISNSLWIPTSSRYGTYDPTHRKLSLVSLEQSIFNIWLKDNIEYNNLSIEEKYLYLLKQPYFLDFLNTSGIKYLIVPIEDKVNNDNFFVYYGGQTITNIRQFYISQLDHTPYLKRLNIGTKELVIFENINYEPYIRTTTSLIEYSSLKNLSDKYLFASSTLNFPLDFVIQKAVRFEFPATSVRKLYEDINLHSVVDDSIKQQDYFATKTPVLYVNTSNRQVTYKYSNNTLSFQNSYKSGLSLNDVPLDTFTDKNTLSSFPIIEGQKYLVANDSEITLLEKSSDWKEINTNNNLLTIYKVSAYNTVPNGSFENSLWQSNVGDCNKFDELPVLSMSREKTATDGDWSLQLGATRHIACTNTDIPDIAANNLYLFSFDYQSESAKQAGFYLSFGNSTTTVVSEQLPIISDNWQHFEKILRIPAYSSKANLNLYAYATDEETNNSVRYDNVKMLKLSEVGKVNPQIKDKFVSTPLPATEGEQTFTFTDPSVNFSNKIPNGDLSDGLWSKDVGDCNNYDEYSDLAMDLVTDSRDSGKSLTLTAARHMACTGPQSVSVSEDKTYLLSFEYQSDQKTEAGFNLAWNGTTTTPINQRLQINNPSWQLFETQVTAPKGATGASLLLYAYEKDGVTPTTVTYDNVSLIELPNIQNRYYVVNDPHTTFVEPKNISFDLINPTKKLVHIKGATTPFYLAMSESFHPSWQAQFNNKKINGFFDSWVPFVNPDRIPDEQHFELNGFLNGWYIDTPAYCVQNALCTKNPDGSYDIELMLEFFPQRWFYLGLLISGTTFVGLIGFLIYDSIRRRKLVRQKSIKHISY